MPNCDTAPFSGCNYSKKLITKLMRELRVKQVVETGTYLGHTTKYMAETFPDVQIKTVELNADHYTNAKKKFAEQKNVECFHGSSDQFMKEFKSNGLTTLYYLDAHWNDYNPLRKEIQHIVSKSSGKDIIVIDDCEVTHRNFWADQVPGGGKICLDYVKDLFDWDNWQYFYKNQSDNPGTQATGQLYIVHKSLNLPKDFIVMQNELPYSPCLGICVLTLLIGDLSYKEIAKHNHKTYCDKHNYTYVCVEEKLNDYHPMWMKPDLIKKYLNKGYEYVLWMDGDSFFINMDIKLEDFTLKDVDLVAAGDKNDIVNTGHIFLKNSEWSMKFVDKWIGFRKPLTDKVLSLFKQVTTHFTQYQGRTYLNDQPPFNLILGGANPEDMKNWFDIFNQVNLYEGNDYKKHGIEYSPVSYENLERTHSLITKKLRDHVNIVTQDEMNAYPSTYKKGDFILHYAEGNKDNIATYITKLTGDYSMNTFDSKLYELDDNKQIQKIVKSLYNPNDFSTNLEGNCMYTHFTYDRDMTRKIVRQNLYNCAKHSQTALEIGVNAGHSSMLFLNANPNLHLLCFDMCYHKYTQPCVEYLASKYSVTFVPGDSRNTTFRVPGEKYDLIHVDGGHSKELAFKDIINTRYVAHEKTLLIIDDADYTQITDIIDFLISCNVLKEVNYESINCVPNIYHRIFHFIK